MNMSHSFTRDTSDGALNPIFNRMHEVSNNIRQDTNSTKDPHPWLELDDLRTHQTDAEILSFHISLRESALTSKEKSHLITMVLKYQKAIRLQDEIGNFPNIKADIKVINDSPFFVRPFKITEEDKPFMNRQMERVISLGILTGNSTSFMSPVMLITCKLTKD